ncbi:MAG: sigma-70 family RNA polymerase sigma factor [Alphaproteobacteria bacterium]|nr:sigma-70 family RNA polymerase sigma factor [Alphaproteobacteria bacterium]
MDNKKIKDLLYQIAIYEDEYAYKQLFMNCFISLQNFGFSFLKNRSLAEEIASDVLLDVWKKKQYYNDIENPKSYFLTVVKNACLKVISKDKKLRLLPLHDVKTEFFADYGTKPNEEENNYFEVIDSTVSQLPEKCKLIFKMAKEDKLKYKEIASLLNISVKTIDAQLAIAIKRITEALIKVKKNEKIQ